MDKLMKRRPYRPSDQMVTVYWPYPPGLVHLRTYVVDASGNRVEDRPIVSKLVPADVCCR